MRRSSFIHAASVLDAISKSAAMIEFDTTGKVVDANEAFCTTMGYSLDDVRGRHHSIFVPKDEARSPEYAAFWDDLRSGKPQSREFRRIGKDGRDVWLRATYSPVLGWQGKVTSVVKMAMDVTHEKEAAFGDAGKLKAISLAQGVIEFTCEGVILSANENFLKTVGYELAEIRGRHHRMFVDPAYAAGQDYAAFWQKLNRGEFIATEFRRIGKGGREIWLQAFYSPIFDLHGRVVRVVKFATDITDRVRALNDLGGALADLADGKLDQHLGAVVVPSMEALNRDFNSAVRKLRDVMTDIEANSKSLETEASEVSAATDDLSRRTEQQAAALEQTSAAFEQIRLTIAASSERADVAGQSVNRAHRQASQTGVVVQEAVEAMDRIETSSREISSIISVIDEIAFQTNLLALNAGVEAARAGEAGRGFAVVALEVRALAQRSADAAREIKQLIANAADEVKTGVALVGRTGAALGDIAREVDGADKLMAAIVSAARDQAATLLEINGAIGAVDKTTQQNAAMVEETTAVSQSLSSRSRALMALLARFDLGLRRRDLKEPSGDSGPRAMMAQVERSFAGARGR